MVLARSLDRFWLLRLVSLLGAKRHIEIHRISELPADLLHAGANERDSGIGVDNLTLEYAFVVIVGDLAGVTSIEHHGAVPTFSKNRRRRSTSCRYVTRCGCSLWNTAY